MSERDLPERDPEQDPREELIVDGESVRFLREDGDTWAVVTGNEERLIGRLALVKGGSRFIAYRPDGIALTKPSPWGGEVTAQFGSRELAARALLRPRDRCRDSASS